LRRCHSSAPARASPPFADRPRDAMSALEENRVADEVRAADSGGVRGGAAGSPVRGSSSNSSPSCNSERISAALSLPSPARTCRCCRPRRPGRTRPPARLLRRQPGLPRDRQDLAPRRAGRDRRLGRHAGLRCTPFERPRIACSFARSCPPASGTGPAAAWLLATPFPRRYRRRA
jgi:hypothetical protein